MNGNRNKFIILGVAVAVVLGGFFYFRMPSPRLDNLERPALTLMDTSNMPDTPRSRAAARKNAAMDNADDDDDKPAVKRRAPRRSNFQRKSAAERRAAAKKRREERLKRRRDARSNRVGETPSRVSSARANRPTRGRSKFEAPTDLGEDLDEPLDELPPEDLLPLEELEEVVEHMEAEEALEEGEPMIE